MYIPGLEVLLFKLSVLLLGLGLFNVKTDESVGTEDESTAPWGRGCWDTEKILVPLRELNLANAQVIR